MILTKKRIYAGAWEGILTGAEGHPGVLELRHLGDVVGAVTVTQAETAGEWIVRAEIPADTLSDGVQTYLIVDSAGGVLSRFHLMAGEGLDEDIRAELDLIRAELDMLKRAFRRHCSDTQTG